MIIIIAMTILMNKNKSELKDDLDDDGVKFLLHIN